MYITQLTVKTLNKTLPGKELILIEEKNIIMAR